MLNKEIADKINQLLNNGFAFNNHITEGERKILEQEMLDWYDKNFYGALVKEEMLFVVDRQQQKIMMMEITKNSIYFNPYDHSLLVDLVVLTLEFVTDYFKIVTEDQIDTSKEIDFEDESTEELPKPKPCFDFL
jgi:hypothetical protein